MESITVWLRTAIVGWVPSVDLSPLIGKANGKLKLTPEQLLAVIQAEALAAWALKMTARLRPARIQRGPGGRPASYREHSVLLMAVVQGVWRKSYDQIVDEVRSNDGLAAALGFDKYNAQGKRLTISQGQYWERRQQLGNLPFIFFFLALVGCLIRLGVITGKELIVDATLLRAWYHADPGATWQKYQGKAAVFGYKVHTVLCRNATLPIFFMVTPAHCHDSPSGCLALLLAFLLFGLKTWVVYADSAYFDKRMFHLIHNLMHAHPAIHYNLRKAGKRKLATCFFLEQWQRLVIDPRSDIQRHFAWMKRYFGLKYFQCFSLPRVTQFVILTYIAALAVALAAERYQRPDLYRSRSKVLAHL